MTLSSINSSVHPVTSKLEFTVDCPTHGRIDRGLSFVEAENYSVNHDLVNHPRAYKRAMAKRK